MIIPFSARYGNNRYIADLTQKSQEDSLLGGGLIIDLTHLAPASGRPGEGLEEVLKSYLKGLNDDKLLRYYGNPA